MITFEKLSLQDLEPSSMLVSKDKNLTKVIDTPKVLLGRFLTTGDNWLSPQVQDFILEIKPRLVLDPFAGDGDLLSQVSRLVPNATLIGMDIQGKRWIKNDSLLEIPRYADLIVTNPPFLAKYSAKRKNLWRYVEFYFDRHPQFNDLYQIALWNCQQASDYVISILPETFLNSGYDMNGIRHCTILSKSPFSDTTQPVCVAAWQKGYKGDTAIYRDNKYLLNYSTLKSLKLTPKNKWRIRFNAQEGNLGLIAVDGQSPDDRIRFTTREQLLNRYSKEIKHSSRLITLIEVKDISDFKFNELIDVANKLLEQYRQETRDVALSPFKGNNKFGERRRRLDYKTARAILELAMEAVLNGKVGLL